MNKKLLFVLGILVSCLCATQGQQFQIMLSGNTDSIFPDPARVSTPSLPAGNYEVSLSGPGVQPTPFVKKTFHYAYIVAYGNQTEVEAVLNGLGDKKSISLPMGGVISAFLRDTDADRSGSVTLTVRNTDSATACTLQLFDATNSVDISKMGARPAQRFLWLSSNKDVSIPQQASVLWPIIEHAATNTTKLTNLPAGKYRLTLGGEGILQYPNAPLTHYAFIAARGVKTEISACLFGKGDSLVISLPEGASISAFLQDSDPTDNSGSVIITVERVKRSWL